MNQDTVQIRSTDDDIVQRVNNMMPSSIPDNSARMAQLKLKINTLLWEELPDETAIGDAEIMACKIFEMINEVG